MQVNWNFNANQHDPNQGMSAHPPANKIGFQITNTAIVETKDKTGAMLVVDLTSPMGTIIMRYNIHNANPKAVEIAYGQLSALCRAVGIFQIDGNNECAALRGGKGLMDVGYQKGEEPDPAFPDRKGYTELKRVYDINGNDPSKPAGAQQAAPQGQQGGFGGQPQQRQPDTAQPLQQQPGGGWGQGNVPATQPAQQQPQTFQQPNQAQPNQGQPNQGQAWQPGGGQPNAAPPWGQR